MSILAVGMRTFREFRFGRQCRHHATPANAGWDEFVRHVIRTLFLALILGGASSAQTLGKVDFARDV
jgi:hypothetical protein